MIDEEIQPEYLHGDVVWLNPANVMYNDFHYGAVPDVEALGSGIVLKSNYSKPIDKMSYLVEFEKKEYWFLGHEIY